ncbi:hypothetical protein D3C73_1389640 [compost metagenome]
MPRNHFRMGVHGGRNGLYRLSWRRVFNQLRTGQLQVSMCKSSQRQRKYRQAAAVRPQRNLLLGKSGHISDRLQHFPLNRVLRMLISLQRIALGFRV